MTEELALQQAARPTTRSNARHYRWTIHGFSGAKDLYGNKGIKNTWGAARSKSMCRLQTPRVVDRLEEAGRYCNASHFQWNPSYTPPSYWFHITYQQSTPLTRISSY